MPSPNTGGGICNTRANMSLGLTKTKARDNFKKQMDSYVKDPISAANFLMEGDFKSEDDELSFELLSVIAMQLSQQTRSPKLVLEAFKALSYLILDIHRKHTTESITDTIAKKKWNAKMW